MNRFRPTARIQTLRRRAQLLAELREFFLARDFWEVETPILAPETVIDRHLEPISAEWPLREHEPTHRGRQVERAWLQTSPELHMKRLMAAGADAIFQITHAFRGDELGSLHNPEFTMLEWYRAGDTLDSGMQLLDDLCDRFLSRGSALRLTYADAFAAALDINPHRTTAKQLRQLARDQGIAVPDSIDQETEQEIWLNLLMAECVEPRLSQYQRPVILYHYPASQAALARLANSATRSAAPVAERFELYVSGIELANGYCELQDADQLAERQRHANAQRQAEGKRRLTEPASLIDAMRHGLPDCVGVALGFDRLVMLALGERSMRDVMAFPWQEPSA